MCTTPLFTNPVTYIYSMYVHMYFSCNVSIKFYVANNYYIVMF